MTLQGLCLGDYCCLLKAACGLPALLPALTWKWDSFTPWMKAHFALLNILSVPVHALAKEQEWRDLSQACFRERRLCGTSVEKAPPVLSPLALPLSSRGKANS